MKWTGFRFFHISTLLYNSLVRKSILNLRKLHTENNFKINMCVLVVPVLPEQKFFSRKKLNCKGFEPPCFFHTTVLNFKFYGYHRLIDFKLVPIGPLWKSNWYHKPQNWLMMHWSTTELPFFVLGKGISEKHEVLPKPEWQPMNDWFVSREFLRCKDKLQK